MTRAPLRDEVRGNVLPTVLILLGGLALLALGATQSSLLELAMSGNELYRLRAAAAAETALAEAQAALAAAAPGVMPAARVQVPLAGQPGDEFDVALRDAGDDPRLAALSGGARSGRHYAATATGRSRRGAQARLEIGVRVVRDAGGTVLAVEREFWLRKDID